MNWDGSTEDKIRGEHVEDTDRDEWWNALGDRPMLAAAKAEESAAF